MTYLAHTAHAQLAAFGVSCVGWTLTVVALGLIPWRVWLVSDSEVIPSGVAWVGLWRACFNTHTMVTPGFRVMHCKYIGLSEAFTPPEIGAGQILMVLSLVVGMFGNAGCVYALRNVNLDVERVRLSFLAAGGLCLLAAAMSLIPLLWNLSSVVTNQTIAFPQDFKMPQAPNSQRVGPGIGIGLVGSILMVISGIIFCKYKLPRKPLQKEEVHPEGRGARDNLAFESLEHL